MSLFGSHRDDRRRRSLAEDSATDTAVPAAAALPKLAKTERYTAAARPEKHRRLSDFVPRRRWTVTLSYLAGLTVVSGLLVGFAAIGDLPPELASVARLLDASVGGSLAGWFSSLVFGLAALTSLIVYSVRRHKTDDYRGGYRVWLWAAAAWSIMSVDAVANLHTPFSQAMALATKWSMLTDGAIWWIGAWGMLLGVLAIRLAIEVRQCRTATMAMVTAFALWGGALAIDYAWLGSLNADPLLPVGLRLVGQVTLLTGIGLYARHVLLDAEGLLPAARKKPRREKEPAKGKSAPSTSSANETGRVTRIDAAHKSSERQAVPQRHADVRDRSYDSDAEEQYDEYGEESEVADRKLSKAERKRIRREMRRQQREEEE